MLIVYFSVCRFFNIQVIIDNIYFKFIVIQILGSIELILKDNDDPNMLQNKNILDNVRSN